MRFPSFGSDARHASDRRVSGRTPSPRLPPTRTSENATRNPLPLRGRLGAAVGGGRAPASPRGASAARGDGRGAAPVSRPPQGEGAIAGAQPAFPCRERRGCVVGRGEGRSGAGRRVPGTGLPGTSPRAAPYTLYGPRGRGRRRAQVADCLRGFSRVVCSAVHPASPRAGSGRRRRGDAGRRAPGTGHRAPDTTRASVQPACPRRLGQASRRRRVTPGTGYRVRVRGPPRTPRRTARTRPAPGPSRGPLARIQPGRARGGRAEYPVGQRTNRAPRGVGSHRAPRRMGRAREEGAGGDGRGGDGAWVSSRGVRGSSPRPRGAVRRCPRAPRGTR